MAIELGIGRSEIASIPFDRMLGELTAGADYWWPQSAPFASAFSTVLMERRFRSRSKSCRIDATMLRNVSVLLFYEHDRAAIDVSLLERS